MGLTTYSCCAIPTRAWMSCPNNSIPAWRPDIDLEKAQLRQGKDLSWFLRQINKYYGLGYGKARVKWRHGLGSNEAEHDEMYRTWCPTLFRSSYKNSVHYCLGTLNISPDNPRFTDTIDWILELLGAIYCVNMSSDNIEVLEFRSFGIRTLSTPSEFQILFCYVWRLGPNILWCWLRDSTLGQQDFLRSSPSREFEWSSNHLSLGLMWHVWEPRDEICNRTSSFHHKPWYR